MNLYAVTGFLAAVFPLVATPGTSLTMLTQRVGTGGKAQAPPVILGTVTGLYVHATLAGLGLSALVLRSSQAFAVIRLAGAAYLIALGIATWRSRTSLRTPASASSSTSTATATAPAPATEQPQATPHGSSSTYRQALLGNVLNPKAASIYLTLVPPFLNPHQALLPQFLVLATAQATLITAWLAMWTLLIARTARTLASPRRKALLNRITGAMLVGIGLRTATA